MSKGLESSTFGSTENSYFTTSLYSDDFSCFSLLLLLVPNSTEGVYKPKCYIERIDVAEKNELDVTSLEEFHKAHNGESLVIRQRE